MSDACPFCDVGELANYVSLGASLTEMGKELANPLLLGRVYYALYLHYFTDVRRLEHQYQCKSCNAHAAICSNCSKSWRLAAPLKHWSRLSCPHCKMQYVFRLD